MFVSTARTAVLVTLAVFLLLAVDSLAQTRLNVLGKLSPREVVRIFRG